MMSDCMMMKTKKRVSEEEKRVGVEVEENGEFMQLRSRRLDKSAAALMVAKTRQRRGRGGRKRKAEEEAKELEENNVVETNVKVDEGVANKPGMLGRLRDTQLLLDPKESVTEPVVPGRLLRGVQLLLDQKESVTAAPVDGINYFDGVVENVGGGGDATENGGGGDAPAENEGAGENLVPNDRAIRERTPENLIIRPNDDIIATGSSTKAPGDDVVATRPRISRRLQGGCKPSAKDMEDFFAAFERQQEKHFTEKYNFDFKNETPLPGRYEWVKVEP